MGRVYLGAGRASLWTGTAGSWVNLHPAWAEYSEASGVGGGQQVGFAGVSGVVYRASLWTGTAASWVNLNPAGASNSEAYAVHDGQQVGYADFGGVLHAGMWSGTAGSWLDLHPAGARSSAALGVSNGQQVGYAILDAVPNPDIYFDGVSHASLWSGTAGSWVDLHPAGARRSAAFGVSNGQQVGYADVGGVRRASLWSGTAGSWVDLNPAGAGESSAYGVHGGQQVGGAYFDGDYRAILWSGTADSWVDLSGFLPAWLRSSFSRDVWHDGALTYVVGSAYNPVRGFVEAIMWVSRAIAPTFYSMFRGSVISGNLGSLQNSDNNRLVMRPGAVFSSGEPPIQVILNSTAPSSSPSGFSFSLESNASIANAEQKISLYNFDDEVYEVLDTRLATASENTVNVNVTSDTSRFIQPLTRAIRARVSYRALGSTFVYPWLGRIDKAWWAFPG